MRLNTKESRAEMKQFMIHKGAIKDPRSTDYAEVYIYELAGKSYAQGFIGTSAKPAFHYSFRTPEQRETYITQFLSDRAKCQQYKDDRKTAKKAFKHTLQVGQLMHGSWGYDQTNCELWEVTKLIGEHMVELREVACKSVPGSQGFMSESLQPIKGQYTNKAPVRARVQEGNYCRIHRCCGVSPTTEDSSHYSSWYA